MMPSRRRISPAWIAFNICGQTKALEQAAELQDRALIGQRIVTELKPRKTAHVLYLAERVLPTRARKRILLLQDVGAQHRLQTHTMLEETRRCVCNDG